MIRKELERKFWKLLDGMIKNNNEIYFWLRIIDPNNEVWGIMFKSHIRDWYKSFVKNKLWRYNTWAGIPKARINGLYVYWWGKFTIFKKMWIADLIDCYENKKKIKIERWDIYWIVTVFNKWISDVFLVDRSFFITTKDTDINFTSVDLFEKLFWFSIQEAYSLPIDSLDKKTKKFLLW